jgi:hypothetical protein
MLYLEKLLDMFFPVTHSFIHFFRFLIFYIKNPTDATSIALMEP